VNPDFRALLQLRVRSPPVVVRPPIEADALLAFILSEAYQTSRWAFALPSCAYRLTAFDRSPKRTPQIDRLATLQGVNPTDPERVSEEILQPP
jgi:hypothetical protein